MVRVTTFGLTGRNIRDSGRTIKLTDLERTFIKTAGSMRGTGKIELIVGKTT